MSALKRSRKKVNYDHNPPRCEICKFYKKPGLYLKNSLPIPTPPLCKMMRFTVKPVACCDKWQDKDGTPLEGGNR